MSLVDIADNLRTNKNRYDDIVFTIDKYLKIYYIILYYILFYYNIYVLYK